MVESLAIVGLGLMGGSLGLAAKARGAARRVVGYARRDETRQEALALGVADAVFDSPGEAVAGADLVVICTPVLTMPELAADLTPHLSAGCVVTDVGSTKAFLADEMERALSDCPAVFVGSHPMAGSEKAGLGAAREALYEKSRVIVTQADGTDADATRRVTAFWEQLGAYVSVLSPQAHDAMIARTSHLPHLLAAALVATVDRDGQDVAPFCGPGFRDTTRVAEGSEQVWHDIVKTNLGPIRQEIDQFYDVLDGLKSMLDQGDLDGVRSFLADCRRKRSTFGK
jgi:prephenate dehydrogenase